MAESSKGLIIQPVNDVSQELNNRQISHAITLLQDRIVQFTSAPGAGDDEHDGYEVGTIWVNTTTDNVYICADNAIGAAVWKVV